MESGMMEAVSINIRDTLRKAKKEIIDKRLLGKPPKERIFHDFKCIFIHIPKTAGNSITQTLNSLPRQKINIKHPYVDLPKHAKASEIKQAVGNEIWEEYFTFAFVRNPWDLMVSSYFWWLQKAPKWKKFHADIKEIEQLGSFTHFMYSQYGRGMINRLEGNLFDWLSEDGEIIVDFVGRFENLHNDWNEICDRIGVEPYELPHTNQTERSSYREYYTQWFGQFYAAIWPYSLRK